jgi:hypothetical protein
MKLHGFTFSFRIKEIEREWREEIVDKRGEGGGMGVL